MLTGENGILTKADTAAQETEIAEAKEQAKLDIAEWVANKLEKGENANINDNIIQELLTKKSYVKEAKETSFTTKKNAYEIPYSELYKNLNNESSEGSNVPISFTVFNGTFSAKLGDTWEQFLALDSAVSGRIKSEWAVGHVEVEGDYYVCIWR